MRDNDRKRHERGHTGAQSMCVTCGDTFRPDYLQTHLKAKRNQECAAAGQGAVAVSSHSKSAPRSRVMLDYTAAGTAVDLIPERSSDASVSGIPMALGSSSSRPDQQLLQGCLAIPANLTDASPNSPALYMIVPYSSDISHESTQSAIWIGDLAQLTGNVRPNSIAPGQWPRLDPAELAIMLAEAAASGKENLVAGLLALNVPLTGTVTITVQTDDMTVPPLHAAAHHGHLTVVAMLVRYGANVHGLFRNGPYEHSPLDLASMQGHVRVIDYLLDNEASLSQGPMYSNTIRVALHLAVKYRHVDGVECLVKHGANIESFGPKFSALYKASSDGCYALVEKLLSLGANPNASGFELDRCSCTAIHAASKNGHVEVIQLLLRSGTEVNTYCHVHCTALYLACAAAPKEYVPECVEVLLDHGANVGMSAKQLTEPRNVKANVFVEESPVVYSCTALHEIVGRSLGGMASQLVGSLLSKGADVNATCPEHGPPLHAACKQGNAATVGQLLGKGADVNTVPNITVPKTKSYRSKKAPRSVFDIAVQGTRPSHLQILRQLLWPASPIKQKLLKAALSFARSQGAKDKSALLERAIASAPPQYSNEVSPDSVSMWPPATSSQAEGATLWPWQDGLQSASFAGDGDVGSAAILGGGSFMMS